MSKYKPMVTEYTNLLINDIEVWLENTNRSLQIFDTLDICHLIGKIQYQQKEIEKLNNIIEKIQNDMVYLDSLGINQVKPKIIWERIELLKGVDKE